MYCTEANEATQTHCYNAVVPAYPVGHIMCMDDHADAKRILLFSSPAQHRRTGSETTPPYASQSSRFGSEPPSVEDDVDIWRYAIFELHARNDDDDDKVA